MHRRISTAGGPPLLCDVGLVVQNALAARIQRAAFQGTGVSQWPPPRSSPSPQVNIDAALICGSTVFSSRASPRSAAAPASLTGQGSCRRTVAAGVLADAPRPGFLQLRSDVTVVAAVARRTETGMRGGEAGKMEWCLVFSRSSQRSPA
jgi:hypothetical protein